MKFYKIKYGESFSNHEFRVNMMASFLAGAIGSGLTNCFDVVTINKQANPDLNIWKMINE